jgi:hypothetical protein
MDFHNKLEYLSLVGSGLTRKHLTRLKKLARYKHSSLLRKSVNYGHKKFFDTGPWLD